MNAKHNRIILVDDSEINLVIGKNILRPLYHVISVPSAAKMFEVLEKVMPDLILLDIEMPEMNGYEAIKKLKASVRFSDIPVIFLTAKDDEDSEMEGFDLGAADYVTKPFYTPLLLKRIEKEMLIVNKTKELVKAQGELKDYADNLEERVREKTDEIFDLQNAVLTTVSDLVECRDRDTGGHIMRTKSYLKILLDEMSKTGLYKDEISKWDMDFFLASTQLHDVGKIAITDPILNKPVKLTDEEFEIMKSHVTVGVEAIEKIMRNTAQHSFLNHALRICGSHHEKWDGSGYPTGLKGNGIPLEGRLMAIADVYDALISERPYKKAFTHEEACGIIEEGIGTQFDPALVEVFRSAKSEFEKVALEREIMQQNPVNLNLPVYSLSAR